MLYILKLLVLVCFVSFVASQTISDHLLPPRNVSLTWNDEFRVKVKLTWKEPEYYDKSCKFLLTKKIGQKERVVRTVLFEHVEALREGLNIEGMVKEVSFSIKTMCNKNLSEPVVRSLPPPIELVRDLQCSVYSLQDMNCSWTPTKQTPDLQLYYWFSHHENEMRKECRDYLVRGNVTTGCHLMEGMLDPGVGDLYILLNDTLNGTSIRNTFVWDPRRNVRLPPLKCSVNVEGGYLHLNWEEPTILPRCWRYIVNYTSCEESDIRNINSNSNSTKWPYAKQCQYHRVRIKGEFTCDNEGTPWSEEIIVNTSCHHCEIWTYVPAVVIPLMVAVFALMVLFCVRRHKDKFLPKVPDPTNLLQDMINNNSERPPEVKLYVPGPEEECSISLVQESDADQPDP